MASPFSQEGFSRALSALGLKDEPSTLKQYGIPSAIGLGATAALYALLRKQRLSANPILRAIQKASKGRLTGIETAGAPFLGKHRPGLSEKMHRRLLNLIRGTDDVIFHTPDKQRTIEKIEKAYREGKPPHIGPVKKIEGGVFNYSEPYLTKKYPGDTQLAENITDMHRLSDKLREGELLQKYMPEIAPTTLNLQHYLPQHGTTTTTRIQHLRDALQKHLPEGYIIKPRQGNATGDIIHSTDDIVKLLREKGQKGDWAREMIQDPSKYIVQEKLPIITEKRIPLVTKKYHTGQPELPIEYRAHTIGGQLIPGAISRRYPTRGALNPIKTWLERRRLIKETQPQLDKLPEQYRAGMPMSLDIAKTPSGFKIIETNAEAGGRSGFYAPDVTGAPTLASHHLYRAITGRHSKPMAAAKALLGGSAAVTGTAALV